MSELCIYDSAQNIKLKPTDICNELMLTLLFVEIAACSPPRIYKLSY